MRLCQRFDTTSDQIVPNDTGMGWQPHDPTNPDDDIIIEI